MDKTKRFDGDAWLIDKDGNTITGVDLNAPPIDPKYQKGGEWDIRMVPPPVVNSKPINQKVDTSFGGPVTFVLLFSIVLVSLFLLNMLGYV